MKKKVKTTEGKSGYEIRLEILAMAMDAAGTKWFQQQEAERYKAEKNNSCEIPMVPDTRIEEALKNASELYKFVEEGR